MTQDCLNSPSTASESNRFPKGIHVIGAEKTSASKVEGIYRPYQDKKKKDTSRKPTSWSYLYLQHKAAKTLQKWLDTYNGKEENALHPQPYFIHQSLRYQYGDKENECRVKKTLEPTVCGLVFLQGTVKDLQEFLKQNFPNYHLVNDRSKARPASIEDAVMQPFMNVMKTHPEQVTFLRDPFEKFAREHVKLRVLTGPFAGYEGYIVRIDRDRQLVFDFGGYAVAIRGVHKEDFEEVVG